MTTDITVHTWIHDRYGTITGTIAQDDHPDWIDIRLAGDHALRKPRGRCHYQDGLVVTFPKAHLRLVNTQTDEKE